MSVAAGIVQRGPAGDPILLPTPAIQTTFSNESLAFWREVHREMAQIMAEAGVTPYLQFGEVQWWYFNSDGLGRQFSGMPYYDAATQAAFTAQYGRPMAVILDHFADPNQHPEEAAFLASRIGWFCDQIIDHVRASFPDCRFEVLYPTDVNQTAWNFTVNYAPSWNPSRLTCLKTEGFGNTYNRDVESAKRAMEFGAEFGSSRRAHLVGVGDPQSSWVREARQALNAGFESVVFWALDQFCLVGYPLPFETGGRRSVRLG
jgi:hypothetical protein